jgi:hypothetical protein
VGLFVVPFQLLTHHQLRPPSTRPLRRAALLFFEPVPLVTKVLDLRQHLGRLGCIAPVRTALRDLVEDEDIGV